MEQNGSIDSSALQHLLSFEKSLHLHNMLSFKDITVKLFIARGTGG